MPSGFTRSPKFVKGALIRLSEGFIGPVPNVILFQYNPETISRKMESFTGIKKSTKGKGEWGEVTTSEPFDPEESFNLTLELDATDDLEKPHLKPDAVIFGVADRIAALEMLLYPTRDDELGDEKSSVPKKGSPVPKGRVPIILFVWGPGKIVPVRITSFSVKEEAYSTTLYPVRATVEVGLQVLTKKAIDNLGDLTEAEKLALTAYKRTRAQKEILARKNMLNNIPLSELLPF